MQHPVKDRGSQVGVVQDLAPLRERLIGREKHGLSSQIPPVDDVVEDVRSVLPEGQVDG